MPSDVRVIANLIDKALSCWPTYWFPLNFVYESHISCEKEELIAKHVTTHLNT